MSDYRAVAQSAEAKAALDTLRGAARSGKPLIVKVDRSDEITVRVVAMSETIDPREKTVSVHVEYEYVYDG